MKADNLTVKPLITTTLTELYETVYPPKTMVIENLLYSGTYIFAGAPKIGKSFLMAQIAYHVAMGIPLWENRVQQATVLYLALEDVLSRLQGRLSRMFGLEDCDFLHFTTHSEKVGMGLEEQLDEFISRNPKLKLIIVDTFQKVREARSDGYSYQADYEMVSQLKSFSDKNNLCILMVHHTRKEVADDVFDMISGTKGILGAADGGFMLAKEKRTHNTATLDALGRDQQDLRLHLKTDPVKRIWLMERVESELWNTPKDLLIDSVSKLVSEENPEWNGSASDVVNLLQLEINANVLTRRLNVGVGVLKSDYNIRYESKRSRTGCNIRLVLEMPFGDDM